MAPMYSARQEALDRTDEKALLYWEGICQSLKGLLCEGERVECLQISVLSCTRPRLNDRDNVDYLILSSGLSGWVSF